MTQLTSNRPAPNQQPTVDEELKASILRRMRFAAHSRHAFDASMGKITRALRIALGQSPQLVPDRIVQICSDLIESLRTGGLVPNLGNVRASTPLLGSNIPQMPGDEGFIYEPLRKILIGTHVGVDFVRSNGRFYIVDINGAAAMKPKRRALYATKFDPVVTNLVLLAKELKFRKLVVVRWHWEGIYETEWTEAGRLHGVEVVPACYSWFDATNPRSVSRFPVKFADQTMYVSFGNRYSPFEFFLNDKIFADHWIRRTLNAWPEFEGVLATPTASTTLYVPPLAIGREGPNLVVKVSGKNSGAGVAMARVKTDEDVMAALGMKNRTDFPSAFKTGWMDSVLDRIFGRTRLLFQDFVSPDTDARGHAQIFRLHVFISPLASRFLAAHKVVAPRPLPTTCAYGLVGDPSAYIVNASLGSKYALLSDQESEEVAQAGAMLGELLRRGAANHFSPKLLH